MNSVTCLAWVKRGASKQHPDRGVLNDDELKRVIESQNNKLKRLELGEDDSDSDSGSEELKHKSAKNEQVDQAKSKYLQFTSLRVRKK